MPAAGGALLVGAEVSDGATSVLGRLGVAVVGGALVVVTGVVAADVVAADVVAADVVVADVVAADVEDAAFDPDALPHAVSGRPTTTTARTALATRLPPRISRSSRIRRDTPGMSYDHETADRVRECLATTAGVSEKAMFGGLAFLVDGHMAVAVSRNDGLLLRCDRAQTEELATRPHVGRWEMRGKEMAGWLRVDPPAYESDEDLASWVTVGVEQARLVK